MTTLVACDAAVLATVTLHVSGFDDGGLPGSMKCAPNVGSEALSVVAVWMSMRRCTVVVVLFALFAAFVSFGVETETLSVMTVPSATVELTFTTSEKLPLFAPAASVPPTFDVHVNEPVPPTAGTPLQVKPVGGVKETKVVLAGIVSVR